MHAEEEHVFPKEATALEHFGGKRDCFCCCLGGLLAAMATGQTENSKVHKGGLDPTDSSCRLLVAIPFSDSRTAGGLDADGTEVYGRGSWPSPEAAGEAGYGLMAAAVLAMDHFVSFYALPLNKYTLHAALPTPTHFFSTFQEFEKLLNRSGAGIHHGQLPSLFLPKCFLS